MAGVFAHEIRNALFPAAAAIHKIKEDATADNSCCSNLRKYALIAEQAITNASNTTKQITTYNKLNMQRIPEKVNMAEIVNEVIHNNRMHIDNGQVKIKISGKENIAVWSNRQQLIIALNNILLNAFQAMTQHKNPRLSITWKKINEGLVLSIGDNGQGIPKERQSKIFDLFFTTREDQGGTGMGLSTAREIIEMYGGKISVTSAPNKGACFNIQFELVDRVLSDSPF